VRARRLVWVSPGPACTYQMTACLNHDLTRKSLSQLTEKGGNIVKNQIKPRGLSASGKEFLVAILTAMADYDHKERLRKVRAGKKRRART
jgi:hypothetical protein